MVHDDSSETASCKEGAEAVAETLTEIIAKMTSAQLRAIIRPYRTMMQINMEDIPTQTRLILMACVAELMRRKRRPGRPKKNKD